MPVVASFIGPVTVHDQTTLPLAASRTSAVVSGSEVMPAGRTIVTRFSRFEMYPTESARTAWMIAPVEVGGGACSPDGKNTPQPDTTSRGTSEANRERVRKAT